MVEMLGKSWKNAKIVKDPFRGTPFTIFRALDHDFSRSKVGFLRIPRTLFSLPIELSFVLSAELILEELSVSCLSLVGPALSSQGRL